MPRKDVHITFDNDKGKWKVSKEGAERASGYRETQDEARELGKRIAEREHSDLLIHRKDNGQIREKNSHGNDPRKRKG